MKNLYYILLAFVCFALTKKAGNKSLLAPKKGGKSTKKGSSKLSPKKGSPKKSKLSPKEGKKKASKPKKSSLLEEGALGQPDNNLLMPSPAVAPAQADPALASPQKVNLLDTKNLLENEAV